MNPEELDVMLARTYRIARRLAASERGRIEDLQQEAMLGILEAMARGPRKPSTPNPGAPADKALRSGFDPERGSWGGYCNRTGWNRASKLSWRMSSPASARSSAALPALGKTTRCGEEHADRPVDATAHEATEHAQVVALLRAVIARGRHADAVAEVLLRDRPLYAVAEAHEIPEHHLSAAVAETRRAIKSDRRLRDFARAA